MVSVKQAKLYCCEDISKIYGYAEAVADKEKMWHCHHCLGLVYSKEQMIEKGLYYNQPAEMLMFVTTSEHFKLHSTFIRDNDGRKTTKLHNREFLSEETRSKISESMKGRIFTPEHRKKIGLSNIGKTLSEKTKKQISESRKGKGKQPKSVETKQKMSESRKEYWKKHSKHVFQFTLNGEFIKEWNSIWEIHVQLGYDMKGIRNVCIGKAKHSHKFIWKYAD